MEHTSDVYRNVLWPDEIVVSKFHKMPEPIWEPVSVLNAAERAELIRQAAEVAWDACVAACQYEDGEPVEVVSNGNPYRKEKG